MSATNSVNRVPKHTSPAIQEQLNNQTKDSIRIYSRRSLPDIDQRLNELDQEWDIERTIQANAAGFSLLGLGLASAFSRRWLLLPAGVAAFLLQHSVQGWCPPVPLLRRLGFRTAQEIDEERYALKVLRGDFDDVTDIERKDIDAETLFQKVAHVS